MSYKVAKGASIEELESSVAELESKGYVPQGGIGYNSRQASFTFTYFQAMYKKNIVEITSPE